MILLSFTIVGLTYPLVAFVQDVSSASSEIFKIEPVRGADHCQINVHYEGTVLLKNFTLWMGNHSILIGDLGKGSVKNVTVDCSYMEEPNKLSFTIGGLYPVELEFKRSGESV
ncbi:MAG: hypothetical protein QXW45_03280 [Thermosphaera sp.]